MAELIGFLIIFGSLAAVIGFLTTGTIRIIAFIVLAVLAVYIGSPAVQRQLAPVAGGVTTGTPGFAIEWTSLIPILIVFGVLATVIGMLVKGALRYVGFGVIAALALIFLSPGVRDQLASLSVPFFNQNLGVQGTQPTQTFPQPTPGAGQVPSNDGTPPDSTSPGGGVGGPASPIPPAGQQPGNQPGRPGATGSVVRKGMELAKTAEMAQAEQDILVIGGGLVGLAIALELRLRGASVTVLSRNFEQAAAHAAAGMLAPHAEELGNGPLLDLCLRSQALYPEWTRKIEEISGLPTHYWPSGILAPLYQPLPSPNLPNSFWLDRTAIHHAQPGLSEAVIGGWWFPEDGQVDNRALAQALRVAAQSVGVQLEEGVEVTGIQQQGGKVVAVQSDRGEWRSSHYVLATGAWSRSLLPVPVNPRKGQMLSLVPPVGQPVGSLLQQVLYGPDVYLVPRRDGRIVVGATSEAVGFTPGNTAAGIQSLLAAATRLLPGLQDWLMQECWWGFRPATPDESPLLGGSPCENLTLATGHYRNGVLLTPVTAALIADWVEQNQTDPLLLHFSWERFLATSSQPPASSVFPSNATPMLHYPTPTTDSGGAITLLSTPFSAQPATLDSPLAIGGRTFRSRLMTGTGKYRNFEDMRQSVAASGCEIVTVAVRRVQTNAPGHEGLAEALDWNTIWMLPNTAGCQTAEDAVRVARLGREMAKLLGQEDNNFVKLEVIPDAKYLLPDPIGTLRAAEQLVKEGFAVLPYINADPLLAKHLEEAGCATVMPLGSPIGSGQGIRNAANIQIIIENAKIPVVVDAGIGTPSEAAQAMEMGADALLINTAIAQAQNPPLMAQAMGLATQSGRLAYLAGRIPVKDYASASSPLTGTITS